VDLTPLACDATWLDLTPLASCDATWLDLTPLASDLTPLASTGAYSYQQIARYFGVHFTTVGRIVRGGG